LSFEIIILGANSAIPAFDRHQTSQLLRIENKLFLIDCGEGTQLRLAKYRIKLNKIDHIFISHLHGDHYFGLIGIISTMHLYHRKHDLHIYGPVGLSEIITLQLKYSETFLNFRIIFKEIRSIQEVILDTPELQVESIPLSHRINCQGYLFREKQKSRKLIREKLPRGTPLRYIAALKAGENVLGENGEELFNFEDYTIPPAKPRSYAYCSDTRYFEEITEQIAGVNLLYHEATFLSDMEDRARDTFHSTAAQAARIAKMAKVEKLVLGHYSTRYRDIQPLLTEARRIFPNAVLAIEGDTIEIK
jgi:ribonuclease Z